MALAAPWGQFPTAQVGLKGTWRLDRSSSGSSVGTVGRRLVNPLIEAGRNLCPFREDRFDALADRAERFLGDVGLHCGLRTVSWKVHEDRWTLRDRRTARCRI